ncbi:MAG: sulfotransferase family 2 domain-containing protein [Cyanobacteria bacterium SBLK]|nr:sulfotransferase family 2 domain-containing protein [Cyanobacteria bacterium SBLK]
MLISYTQKFIFFHVAKVAGTSMREALKEYAREPDKFRIARPPKMLEGKPNPLYEMWFSFLWHAKARDAEKYLPSEVYHDFYKFAFVRNPWDWQVSMYNFMIKEKIYEETRPWVTFEEYLDWVAITDRPYAKGATKLQKDIISDRNGKIMVDFIGRYENLAQDFQSVCDRLHIEAHLPHVNQSSRTKQDYRTYYNEKTKGIVADIFQEDIQLFGYDFDNENVDFQSLAISSGL